MADKTKKLEKRELRERERAAKRRTRRMYIAAAIALPVALIAAVVLWQLYGPREIPIETLALAPGDCSPVQGVINYGRGDLQAGAQIPTYTDYPPLSGAHLGSPLADGFARETVTNQTISRAIHSLEHGRVVIYVNNLTAEETEQLANLVGRERKVVMLNWAALKDKLVLGAWASWQRCNGVNEQVILSFINTYRDKGPEFVQ